MISFSKCSFQTVVNFYIFALISIVLHASVFFWSVSIVSVK